MNKIGSSPVHKTSLSSKGGGGKGAEGAKEKKRVKIVPGNKTLIFLVLYCLVRNSNVNNNNYYSLVINVLILF